MINESHGDSKRTPMVAFPNGPRPGAELANDADVRLTAPKTLSFHRTRTRKRGGRNGVSAGLQGKELVVRVDGDGFVFEGQRFKSLSAVAKHITGSHCSGQAFFKTKGPK